MDKGTATAGLIGNTTWGAVKDPLSKLWQQDRTHLSVFVIANLFFGQSGLLIAGLFFAQNGQAFVPFWSETISSGALYTFSIALVVSTLATIVFEFIDGQRKQERIDLWDHKLGWSVLAAVIVFAQAALVGGLLSSSNTHASAAVPAAKAAPSGDATAPPLAPANLMDDSGAGKTKPRPTLQVVLWIASMLVALQLFCLYRLPYIQNTHAKQRTEDVAALTNQAEHKTETSYGEKI